MVLYRWLSWLVRALGHNVPLIHFLISALYTLCPKKKSPFYFLNKSFKNWPILMIFGMLNPEKIWHENLTGLPASSVRCSHFTLGSPKKSFSTVLFIRTSNCLLTSILDMIVSQWLHLFALQWSRTTPTALNWSRVRCLATAADPAEGAYSTPQTP